MPVDRKGKKLRVNKFLLIYRSNKYLIAAIVENL